MTKLDPNQKDESKPVPFFKNPRETDNQVFMLLALVGFATFLILVCCLRCQCHRYFTLTDEFELVAAATKQDGPSKKKKGAASDEVVESNR